MSKVLIEKLPTEEIEKRGFKSWPIWEKEVSRFDWYYESDEECLILTGNVTVETDEGHFNLNSGDFVTFKAGLKCIWDVHKPIKKHYRFK